MRLFTIFFLLLSFASGYSYAAKACPGDDYLKFINGRFNICLPLQTFKNAIIVPNGGGVLVKLSNSEFFGIEVITQDMDRVMMTDDMRLYPEMVLGLSMPADLTPKQAEVLANTRAYMKGYYGDVIPIKYKSAGKTFYIISKELDGEAYVSIDDAKDQMLFVSFGRMDVKAIKVILNGVGVQ